MSRFWPASAWSNSRRCCTFAMVSRKPKWRAFWPITCASKRVFAAGDDAESGAARMMTKTRLRSAVLGTRPRSSSWPRLSRFSTSSRACGRSFAHRAALLPLKWMRCFCRAGAASRRCAAGGRIADACGADRGDPRRDGTGDPARTNRTGAGARRYQQHARGGAFGGKVGGAPWFTSRQAVDRLCARCPKKSTACSSTTAPQLLAPNEASKTQLLSEGISAADITVVGSTAIDAARAFANKAQHRTVVMSRCAGFAGAFATDAVLACTVHRAENTTPDVLPGVLRVGSDGSPNAIRFCGLSIRARSESSTSESLWCRRASGFCRRLDLDMLALCSRRGRCVPIRAAARRVGHALGTPVLVLRNETEWMYLVDAGCAKLIGNREADIGQRGLACLDEHEVLAMRAAARALTQRLADGGAAQRIRDAIARRWL